MDKIVKIRKTTYDQVKGVAKANKRTFIATMEIIVEAYMEQTNDKK